MVSARFIRRRHLVKIHSGDEVYEANEFQCSAAPMLFYSAAVLLFRVGYLIVAAIWHFFRRPGWICIGVNLRFLSQFLYLYISCRQLVFWAVVLLAFVCLRMAL